MSLVIRKARADDLPFLKSCARAAYEKYVAAIGREPAPMVADFQNALNEHSVELIEVDKQPAGFAIWYPRGDKIHLENIALLPSQQGKGLGHALLQHVELRAKRGGYDHVELYTHVKMERNVPFYLSHGYVETHRGIQDGFERIFFQKELLP